MSFNLKNKISLGYEVGALKYPIATQNYLFL